MKKLQYFGGIIVFIASVLIAAGCFAQAQPLKTKEVAQPVLRWYPSALLPPVKEPYIIYWDFGAIPVFDGSVSNASGAGPVGAQRGKLQLGWYYGPQNPYIADEQTVIDNYVDTAGKGEAIGLMVDEWQNPNPKADPNSPTHADNPFGITGSIKGIIEAKKIDPTLYIAVAWRGEDSIEPLTKQEQPDLLMIECYTHLVKNFPLKWAMGMEGIKRRIDFARELGMIEQSICWLGQIHKPEEYHPGHVLTAEIIEQQIAELRKYAPEMPGIAFYANTNPELAEDCDRLVRKYFIEPAPEVMITYPSFNAKLDKENVTITAKAKGKDGRKVVRYRWFIDNRLMAETAEPEWKWQLRTEIDGGHFITVHAIDESFNRAASQIHVNVTN